MLPWEGLLRGDIPSASDARALDKCEAPYERGKADNDIGKLKEAEKLAKDIRRFAEARSARAAYCPMRRRVRGSRSKNAIITRDREKWMR